MQIFYTPDITDNTYLLNETESKHCVRVLRLSKGNIIHLSNGKGTLFKAEITDPNPKSCTLKIIEEIPDYEKRNYFLHVAIAPPKNIERFEWFLEKATEIGIDEITPVITENSERKILKPERLEKIIVSALKQSVKAYKPLLNQLISFDEFMNKDTSGYDCFIAHCHEGKKKNLFNAAVSQNNSIIFIGPEGDFSKNEVDRAIAKGFTPVSLGTSRLRTETAAIVATHTFSVLNCQTNN